MLRLESTYKTLRCTTRPRSRLAHGSSRCGCSSQKFHSWPAATICTSAQWVQILSEDEDDDDDMTNIKARARQATTHKKAGKLADLHTPQRILRHKSTQAHTQAHTHAGQQADVRACRHTGRHVGTHTNCKRRGTHTCRHRKRGMPTGTEAHSYARQRAVEQAQTQALFHI